MAFLPYDCIREIGKHIASPFDLYTFACISSSMRKAFKLSLDKNIHRRLHQGVVGTRLQEINAKEKALIGEMGSGKTEIILHYMLHYWQDKGKRIIVAIRADRMDKWKLLAKRILGKEMDLSDRILDNTPILLVTSSAIPFHYFSNNELRDASYEYGELKISSVYGLTVCDEETVIGKKCLTPETIFVHRPALKWRGPLKRVRKAPSVLIKKQHYALPKPIYHQRPFHLCYYENAEYVIENMTKDYNYKKILIICPLYDSVSTINVKIFASDTVYIKDCYYGSIMDRDHHSNTSEKKSIVQFFNYDAINSEVHADCVIYYEHKEQADLLVETEKAFLCASNPHKEVHIYAMDHNRVSEDPEDFLRITIAWRILSRKIGNRIKEAFGKYLLDKCRREEVVERRIRKAYTVCKSLGIPLKRIDPVSFLAYCFPSFYKYIKKICPLPLFDFYQREWASTKDT